MSKKVYELKKDAAAAGTPGPGEVLINRDVLLKPIAAMKSIAVGKGTLPILANVLVELGAMSKVSATDLSVSAVRVISFRTEGNVRFLLPASLAADVLARFDAGDVRLGVSTSGIVMSQGRGEYKFPFADPEEFPEIRAIDSEVRLTISGGDLAHVIGQTAFCVGSDDTRHVYTGLAVQVRGGRIVAAGTDGYRMARFSRAVNATLDVPIMVIPGRSLKALSGLIGAEEEVDILTEEKRIQFATASTTIISRLIEGNYPDVGTLISADGRLVTCNKEELGKALKRVERMAINDEALKLEIGPKECVLSVVSVGGEAREAIDCEYEGNPEVIHLKIRYLPDIVQRLSGEQVDMMLPREPGGTIHIGENDDYDCIMAPIRI